MWLTRRQLIGSIMTGAMLGLLLAGAGLGFVYVTDPGPLFYDLYAPDVH